MPKSKTQSSLFDAPVKPAATAAASAPASGNTPEFSVSELSGLVKRTIEDAFALVRVRGEISDCKLHSSGHLYLTLKEGNAALASVCWKGQVARLGLRPEAGMEVVCTGRLTTFGGQSKYQLVIEQMALAGIGAILKLLEERKQRLAAEGLFDAARKRPLPFLPRRIGVVTSPTGAVIRDILHRLEDRFPRHVLVWPVAVQGEAAAAQIAAAIAGFNALPPDLRPDLLIVARGGGSVEDLMPFNEEIVVRAAAASSIPLISAVGHETDTTLIDYASDLRAPTPTAAAEKAVPVRADLLAMVSGCDTRMRQAAARMLHDRRDRLKLIGRALGDPARALEPLAQRLDTASERLTLGWQGLHHRRAAALAQLSGQLRHPRDIVHMAAQRLATAEQRVIAGWRGQRDRHNASMARIGGRLRLPQALLDRGALATETAFQRLTFGWRQTAASQTARLDKTAAMLTQLSPRAVLARGYALVHDAQGHVVTDAKAVRPGDRLQIEFADSGLAATADKPS